VNQLRIPGAGGGLVQVWSSRLFFKHFKITYLKRSWQKHNNPAQKPLRKKRIVKVDVYGDAHITASFNNIIISLTNKNGQVISWSSAGKMGFKGSKKNTPYAAQMASSDAAKTALDAGLKKVDVFVKGPGSGRESAIRALSNNGIEVVMIKDVTPLPHNGCRPPKKRRV